MDDISPLDFDFQLQRRSNVRFFAEAETLYRNTIRLSNDGEWLGRVYLRTLRYLRPCDEDRVRYIPCHPVNVCIVNIDTLLEQLLLTQLPLMADDVLK